MTIYHLQLTPLADGTDPEGIRRLRAALKALLRQYRLRAVVVQPLTTLARGELGEDKTAVDTPSGADAGEGQI